MNKVDRFIGLATSIGLDVYSFEWSTVDHVQVKYHSIKKAGMMPDVSLCRDHLDYELMMSAWAKAGLIYSPVYANFDEMISGEMKRLKIWAKTQKK